MELWKIKLSWASFERRAGKPTKKLQLTFFENESAGMVEEEVSEVVAVWIDAGLFAQTRRPEERKGLKCTKGGLTFCYCHGAAGN